MSTTNWTSAAEFRERYPHTFNSLQHLVMAMAAVANNRGKKSFFGKDKGLEAYKNFEVRLRDSLLAMVLDGVIKRNTDPSFARLELTGAIKLFSLSFPNWQEAYAFSDEFLVDSPEVAEDCIRSALGF